MYGIGKVLNSIFIRMADLNVGSEKNNLTPTDLLHQFLGITVLGNSVKDLHY